MGDRHGGGRGKEYKVTYILRPPERYHRFGINALGLSAKDGGRKLYTAGRDSVIRIWNVNKNECDTSSSRSLDGHVDWVNDLLVLNGGDGGPDRLVSCSSDTTLRVWDVNQEKSMETVNEHTDYVKALALVNSTTVASGALDSRVCLWDIETWKLKSECGGQDGVKGSVYCLAGCATTGGNIVVVGSTNRLVSVWDARTGDKVAKLKGHNDSVRCLDVRRDGMLLVSGGSDRLIRLWDMRQQRELKWYDPHRDSVWAMQTSKNFQWILSGGRDGSIFHTDIESGVSSVAISAIGSGKDNMVLSMAMTPDESGVWVSNAASSVKLWSVNTATKLKNRDGEDVDMATIPVPPPLAVIPGLPGIISYENMNNRRHVLTKDSNGVVCLWDITRACALKEFGVRELGEVAKEIEEEVFIPSWFSIDIRLGSVAVKLDKSISFNAEIYAMDAGLNSESEEIKVNIGEHVLRGLFKWWKISYEKSLEAKGESPSTITQTDDKTKGDTASATQTRSGYSDYELPEYTKVIISEDGSPVPVLQKEISQLEGSDEELIPSWVLEPVRDGVSMTKEAPKMSFVLQPDASSSLPKIGNSKLSAPRVLRVKKVITFLVNSLVKIAQDESDVDQALGNLKDQDLEILCNGRILRLNMSLGAVKHFVWRDIGDLELSYRLSAQGRKRLNIEG